MLKSQAKPEPKSILVNVLKTIIKNENVPMFCCHLCTGDTVAPCNHRATT